MKPSSWNSYLNKENPWTARLLNLEPFKKVRDLESVETEYNQEKYGKLLGFDLSHADQYRKLEIEFTGWNDNSVVFFSFGEEVFEATLREINGIIQGLILSTLQKYGTSSVVELGCGYGQNFSLISQVANRVRGGEFSENAVRIAHKLGLDIHPFNYYELDDYQVIDRPSAILTIHSVEQIPTADTFIQGLAKHRENVEVVINLEPTYLESRSSLVGILRNRYIELCDYNRDLFNLVSNSSDIEILAWQTDYFGYPLNPANLLVWRFK